MIDAFYAWFVGLVTIEGFLYFLTGFGAAYLAHCARSKMRHKRITIPWHIAGITIGAVALIVMITQTQIAYTTARETAQEVQDCQREFNAALKARSQIAAENDELSQDQRLIVFNWIHNLISPPEPYASMRSDDPLRQQHNRTITIQTDHAFRLSLDRQDVLQDARARNPLPDPTCGKA